MSDTPTEPRVDEENPSTEASRDDIPPPPPSLVPPRDSVRPRISRVPPAPSTRSLPPLPAIEPVLDEAGAAREKGDWEAALDHYKKALLLGGGSDGRAQASLYAYIAEVKLAQGLPREAETNFEKALGKFPTHIRSLDGLIALAEKGGEWSRAAQFRQKRAEALDDDDEKAAEYCLLADVLEVRCEDTRKALQILEGANLAHPGDDGILDRLERLLTRSRQWAKLVDVLDARCRFSTHAQQRGAYRFAQADTLLGRLRDEPRGLAFLELALDEDPQNDRALDALIKIRTRREEWAELAAIYERLVDRFAGLGDRTRAREVCRKLGVLRRDRLLDGPGAIEAMQAVLELRDDDVETRAAIAELYAAKGDRARAVRELETVTKQAPLRAQTYRRLYELHSRAQRPDRAWLIATCLDELGAADVSHELLIEQFRPEAPIRPTTALDPRWWAECVAADGVDPIASDLLLAVSDAAVALRLEDLTAKRLVPPLNPLAKQDAASTASVVRTFVWAARALGIALPSLYLFDDVPSGIAAIRAPEPSTALGPQVRSGMNVQQLAFLAGRHLTYYRPEYYTLVFFPTLAELSALVLAAVRIVIPAIPASNDIDAGRLTELASRLTAEKRVALEDAVTRLDARGGKIDLLTWIRHVELTAARAGLLLAGDLRVPMRIIADEKRAIADLTVDAKRSDLIAYCASEGYGALRERMGVAIHRTGFVEKE